MAAPWLNDSGHFLFLAAKLINLHRCKVGPNITLTKDKISRFEPENIRESGLDFTARFGEINPDMPYLCRWGLSGPQRAVFASFPSVRREPMKKIVKSSIFCEKQVNF